MQLKEALREIETKPVVPLWPHLGLALKLSRGSSMRQHGVTKSRLSGSAAPFGP